MQIDFFFRKKHRKHYRGNLEHNKSLSFTLAKLLFFLSLLIFVHTIMMVYFEGFSVVDSAWLSLTTITTVGYGDLSASTWQGRLATTILMYVVGISLLAHFASEYIDFRMDVRARKKNGRWSWDSMQDHILIINTPKLNSDLYLSRLVEQIRLSPELEDKPIQVLTRSYASGLPSELVDQGVVHFCGVSEDSSNLRTVGVDKASHIIVIARDDSDSVSDSITFDVLNRINEIGTKALVTAEVVYDVNRRRMQKAGASIVLRPIRAYPELVIRSILAPGSEAVMENFFTHQDVRMTRLDVTFLNILWEDIICRFAKSGFGIPMAYIDEQGVHTNPESKQVCSGVGLIAIVNENISLDDKQIAALLNVN